MKCFPLLVVLFLMIVPAQQGYGQTSTTQADSKQAVSDTASTAKKHKKEKPTDKVEKPAKADKNNGKLPTIPGEAAAYELSAPRPPAQVSPK
jgi:hypothetical protein